MNGCWAGRVPRGDGVKPSEAGTLEKLQALEADVSLTLTDISQPDWQVKQQTRGYTKQGKTYLSGRYSVETLDMVLSCCARREQRQQGTCQGKAEGRGTGAVPQEDNLKAPVRDCPAGTAKKPS